MKDAERPSAGPRSTALQGRAIISNTQPTTQVRVAISNSRAAGAALFNNIPALIRAGGGYPHRDVNPHRELYPH